MPTLRASHPLPLRNSTGVFFRLNTPATLLQMPKDVPGDPSSFFFFFFFEVFSFFFFLFGSWVKRRVWFVLTLFDVNFVRFCENEGRNFEFLYEKIIWNNVESG